jgi:hypothetical protein
MPNAQRATCAVLVYREGAFSAMGHDLKIEVPDFTLEVGPDLAIRATARTGSPRVVGVLRDGGAVDTREPSASDRKDIERNIARDILEAEKFPQAAFRSTSVEAAGDRYRVVGNLDLHGVVKQISFTAERRGDRAVARITIHQPDFRIKPFRAMLGALRVKPDVVLEVSAPVGEPPGGRPAAAP